MSNIFKSKFLNEYFKQVLDKENFTLEDLKAIKFMSIINENPDQFIKIDLEDLKVLCNLGIKDFCFEGIDFSDLEFDKTNLNSLEFLRCKLSSCNLDKLQVENSLALFDNVELKNNGLSQFSHMTQLEQFSCIDCNQLDLKDLVNLKNIKNLRLEGNVKNIFSIKNLEQLCKIETKQVSNVLECLPNSENLETIIINDKDIKDIHFLKNYQNLKQVILEQSKIDISQLDTLCDLKLRAIPIEFDETKIKEQLKQREYKFGEEDSKIIRQIFNLKENMSLNDYEFFKQQENKIIKLEIENIETFNKIIKSGILSYDSVITKLWNIEGIDFVVESLEGLSSDAIKYILQNNKQFRFVIRTLNGIDRKLLEQLSENGENLEFYVQGDLAHFEHKPDVSSYNCKNIQFSDLDSLVPYKLQDIKEFIKILEPIKEQTIEAKSDIEKFAIIRKIVLMSSKYDYKGVIDSKEFEKGREIKTRSLKGIFLEGKAVCAGNALGFSIISEYVGLDAKCINGYTISNREEGHEWNQIKITDENNNINWYNYDVTNDPDKINDNSNILQNDETFYKRFIPGEWEKTQKCLQDISNEQIYDISLKRAMKENSANQLVENQQFVEEGQYSGKRITKEDIYIILNSLTLSEFSYLTNKMRQVIQQAHIENEGYSL